MIWTSNKFSGSGLYFWIHPGFGPELVGPFTALNQVTLIGFDLAQILSHLIFSADKRPGFS